MCLISGPPAPNLPELYVMPRSGQGLCSYFLGHIRSEPRNATTTMDKYQSQNRVAVWGVPENTRWWFTVVFLAITVASHAILWKFGVYAFSIELVFDYIIKVGGSSVFATFTIIEGVDFMGWLYESIKRRHREEGREEGRAEGRRERDQAYREWISREQEAGTLGTPKQSPPPFLDDAVSDSKRD